MRGSHKSFSRRSFLRAAAGLTAGTALHRQPLLAQGVNSPLRKIQPQFMITPQQAGEWHLFKSQCGPTYAGSTGWKRYTDFLVSRMQE